VRRPSTPHFATGAAAPAAARPGVPDGNGATVPPAEQAHRSLELFDTVVTGLFHVGLSLHVAMDLPADAARERIAAAVGYLDETIREVRDYAFAAREHQTAPRTSPHDDTV
jgi:hypothetical protein